MYIFVQIQKVNVNVTVSSNFAHIVKKLYNMLDDNNWQYNNCTYYNNSLTPELKLFWKKN